MPLDAGIQNRTEPVSLPLIKVEENREKEREGVASAFFSLR